MTPEERGALQVERARLQIASDYPVPVPLRDDAVSAWHDAPRNEHGVIALDEHMEYILRPVLARYEHVLREILAEWILARLRGTRCRYGHTADEGWAQHCFLCWTSAEIRACAALVLGKHGPTTAWVAHRINEEDGRYGDC